MPYPGGPGHPQVERRIARILQIASLLNREPDQWSRAALASRLGCSTRAIDRDIEILRGLGYVVRRHKGGYAIEAGGGLPEPPEPFIP